MPSEQELRDDYLAVHDYLSEKYYAGEKTEELKRAFNSAHAQNWADFEAAMVAEGYYQLPGPTIEDRVKALEDKAL